MNDSVISAPAAIDTLVTDLNKAEADLRTMMDRLRAARGKLLAVSDGDMFIAFQDAERAWNNTGLDHADSTAMVARRSGEFRNNMLAVDKRGAQAFNQA